MELFLYLREYQDIVNREIQKLAQVQGSGYENVRTHLRSSLPEGTGICISLSSEDFDVNPDQISIRWFEEYYSLPFRIRLRKGLETLSEASITVQVSSDNFPLGDLIVSLGVTRGTITPKVAATQMQWYSEVFASYAHEDIAVVRQVRQRYEDLGITLFVDEYGLRSGVEWQSVLDKQIRTSDIFQLFWSSAASKSKYVKWEWQAALSLESIKGAAFIRPVFWKDPMPPVPDELARRNFHRIRP